MEPEINLDQPSGTKRFTRPAASWEQEAILKLATAGLKEQKRAAAGESFLNSWVLPM